MRTLLALSLLTLFGGTALANDLRNAKSMAAKLVKDPGRPFRSRIVRQRDGLVGSTLAARYVEGNRIAVQTWKQKGKIETSTTRIFEPVDGKPDHLLTETSLQEIKPDGRGGVTYVPTVERTQVRSGKRIGTSATIVTTSKRTGKSSLSYIAKEPAPAVAP